MLSTVSRRRQRRPVCPYCRYEDQVVPIAYGEPDPELLEQSRRGEIALGGGSAGPEAHDWYCKGCLQSFSAPGHARSAEVGRQSA